MMESNFEPGQTPGTAEVGMQEAYGAFTWAAEEANRSLAIRNAVLDGIDQLMSQVNQAGTASVERIQNRAHIGDERLEAVQGLVAGLLGREHDITRGVVSIREVEVSQVRGASEEAAYQAATVVGMLATARAAADAMFEMLAATHDSADNARGRVDELYGDIRSAATERPSEGY